MLGFGVNTVQDAINAGAGWNFGILANDHVQRFTGASAPEKIASLHNAAL